MTSHHISLSSIPGSARLKLRADFTVARSADCHPGGYPSTASKRNQSTADPQNLWTCHSSRNPSVLQALRPPGGFYMYTGQLL